MNGPGADGPVTHARRLREIVGVYDASSTPLGEFAYWVRSRVGIEGCTLCHVTHGPRGPNEDWMRCAASFPAPFVTYHRNDQPDDVRAVARTLPVVLARTDEGLDVVAAHDDIASCAGSPTTLAALITRRLSAWSAPDAT